MSLRDQIELRIKLHDLHVLVAVVEAGSMGRAAARLNTTQPAVSGSIAELERTVGMPLFSRNTRGVEPTACGRALLDGGLAAFDDLRQAATNIEHLADPTMGEVRVGCTPIIASSFVASVLDRLSVSYPRMTFHLATEYLEPLRRKLRDRTLDLLIVRRFSPDSDANVEMEKLSEDRYVVAAGARHRLARRRGVTFSELAAEPWTLPTSDSVIGRLARAAFRSHGLDAPRPTVVANSPELRMRMLETNRFVTIFPSSILSSAGAFQGKSVGHGLCPPQRRERAGTVRGRALSEVGQLFVKTAREHGSGQAAALSR